MGTRGNSDFTYTIKLDEDVEVPYSAFNGNIEDAGKDSGGAFPWIDQLSACFEYNCVDKQPAVRVPIQAQIGIKSGRFGAS